MLRFKYYFIFIILLFLTVLGRHTHCEANDNYTAIENVPGQKEIEHILYLRIAVLKNRDSRRLRLQTPPCHASVNLVYDRKRQRYAKDKLSKKPILTPIWRP